MQIDIIKIIENFTNCKFSEHENKIFELLLKLYLNNRREYFITYINIIDYSNWHCQYGDKYKKFRFPACKMIHRLTELKILRRQSVYGRLLTDSRFSWEIENEIDKEIEKLKH